MWDGTSSDIKAEYFCKRGWTPNCRRRLTGKSDDPVAGACTQPPPENLIIFEANKANHFHAWPLACDRQIPPCKAQPIAMTLFASLINEIQDTTESGLTKRQL